MKKDFLAEWMHCNYERIAKQHQWNTQPTTQVSFAELPEANKKTMLDLAQLLLDTFDMGAKQRGEQESEKLYQMPLILTVKYSLAHHFRSMVEQLQGCAIKNVVEVKSCELLQYWVLCPKELENQITDMALMTYIKNPVFQKYYSDTKEFKEIAQQYTEGRTHKLAEEKKNEDVILSEFNIWLCYNRYGRTSLEFIDDTINEFKKATTGNETHCNCKPSPGKTVNNIWSDWHCTYCLKPINNNIPAIIPIFKGMQKL